MKKVKCINLWDAAPVSCKMKVGDVYYMDEKTRYTDCDGDEYATIYEDEKKEKVIGNRLLSHFCLID